MANPQKENGYTVIANDIMEALAGIRINGEARQCLDIILRKTYGFNKKEDMISLSQFCLLSKLPKPIVCRSLGKLSKMNLIIIKKDNGIAIKYRFNKDFDTWKPLSKKITIIKKDNASLSLLSTTKETTTKENTYKPLKEKKELGGADEAKRFLSHYFERYRKRVGDNVPIYPERIIIPRIEETAELFGGYKKLKDLLEIYFNEDSKFYKENKWSLTCFLSPNILNKLND